MPSQAESRTPLNLSGASRPRGTTPAPNRLEPARSLPPELDARGESCETPGRFGSPEAEITNNISAQDGLCSRLITPEDDDPGHEPMSDYDWEVERCERQFDMERSEGWR